MTKQQLLDRLALENTEITYRRYSIKGRFRGQDFTADYDDHYGWAAGRGIEAEDKNFENTLEWEQWYDDLNDLLETIDFE
jgi:hypothetical protein